MKKDNIYKILHVASCVLVILFLIFISIDYSKYNVTYSAPFTTYIFIRTLEFILPGVVIFILAKIIKNKGK